MKNLKRTLLVGFVWGLIFFLWWVKGFLYQNWNFDIFSKKSWDYLYNEFVSGWVVSATSDWVFVWTLILAVPFFLIGWNLFLKIQWRKSIVGAFKGVLYFLRKKTATVTKKKFKYAPKKAHQKVRPVPLYTNMKALEKQAGKKEAIAAPMPPPVSDSKAKKKPSFDGRFDQAFLPDLEKKSSGLGADPSLSTPFTSSVPSGMPSFLEDDDFANLSLDDIHVPERQVLKENISDILLKAGYKVVADVTFDKVKFDFIAMDATQIFLMSADVEKGDWLADEERFNGEDPLWFSESSHRTSPVFSLAMAAKAFIGRLNAKGMTKTVHPVLIEKMGNIINAEDMQKTWKQQGVLVCRTDMGGPDELPSVEASIPKVISGISEADFEMVRSSF